jgi:hypothetical protein
MTGAAIVFYPCAAAISAHDNAIARPAQSLSVAYNFLVWFALADQAGNAAIGVHICSIGDFALEPHGQALKVLTNCPRRFRIVLVAIVL